MMQHLGGDSDKTIEAERVNHREDSNHFIGIKNLSSFEGINDRVGQL
jgi:hypothetical protein